MAAKPSWYARLEEILAELEALPSPWVTRGTVQVLLGVGPRRAQQIIASCAVEQIGTSVVADRQCLMDHLRSVARGDAGQYEARRRRKVAAAIEGLRRNWLARPKVLVEAPVAIVDQRLDDLPQGVELAPGRITIEFADGTEALRKMLALAMAVGQDMERFESLVAPPQK